MSGVTNTGIVGSVGNDIEIFPANSLTIDIFGSVFYRGYQYGMGDDTGAYWSESKQIPEAAMLYIASILEKSLFGKYDYGHKLRSSQIHDFLVSLPVHTNGEIAFDYMAEFIKEIKIDRLKALDKYLNDSGLNDYKITDSESAAVSGFQNGGGITWSKFFLEDLFTIKNTTNLIKSAITDFNGQTPYVGASRECNGITAYINYNQQLLMQGDTLFIGGKTFTVFYQPDDYFSNDSHNIWLKLKTNVLDSKHTYQFMAACIYNALSDKYEWGNSISRAKIRNDSVYLPILADGTPNYDAMAI